MDRELRADLAPAGYTTPLGKPALYLVTMDFVLKDLVAIGLDDRLTIRV